MQPLLTGIIFFLGTYFGALMGMRSRSFLKKEFFTEESKQSINLGIGLVATMTALILGLITASTHSNFSSLESDVKTTSIKILTLDRLLADYGEETKEVRKEMKKKVFQIINSKDDFFKSEQECVIRQFNSGTEEFINRIRKLKPANDFQDKLYSRIVELSEDLLMSRWAAIHGIGHSIPQVFLYILFFWLVMTFLCFGLLSPNNTLVKTTYFLSALSVGSAVFLIVELDGAYDGFVMIGKESLKFVYKLLNQ